MIYSAVLSTFHTPFRRRRVAKRPQIPYSVVMTSQTVPPIAKRFRGFLPVVVDVETAGFNPQTDALLEIAAVTLHMTEAGRLERQQTHACHVQPFPGANLDPAALAFTGIDPHHPFRDALPEQVVLQRIFQPIRKAVRDSGCSRAILVGHNPWFDLAFINAAAQRTGIKRNPFHPFSAFDTATLGGLAFGQTVLARAAQAAGIPWDSNEAHSAIYDAEQTAELFCRVVNLWEALQFKEDDEFIAGIESN
jgi:ribonuclease T